MSLTREALGKQVQRKERDENLKLPKAAPQDQQPDIQPFFIKIDAKGSVFVNVGAAQERLDGGGEKLPKLDARIELYVAAARLGKAEPVVQIYVEGEAKHERVVDVLNILAKHDIEKVTFTDLIEE